MRFSEYLAAEWRSALGCTEPASIALASAAAAALLDGPIVEIRLTTDPRTYKNCYAVGLPRSGSRSGILWAVALGAAVRDPALGLGIFGGLDEPSLSLAGDLIEHRAVAVSVDPDQRSLHIDCEVRTSRDHARAVIAGDHTSLVRLERNSEPFPVASRQATGDPAQVRRALAGWGFGRLLAFAREMTAEDLARLMEGAALNEQIAQHGLSLFPSAFGSAADQDWLTGLSRLACAGVYARMSGEPLTVMTLAGSGNKGIVCAVPLLVRSRQTGADELRLGQALGLACLVTSATTYHLGTLSAVCGCSNAAGIGLAAGLVHLAEGDEGAISRAVTNMVGNVTGMICDGAKIGCAMKTMTAVDAAFRSASLALAGVGIPWSDGIVGRDGMASLVHLGRIATQGMRSVDAEILAIMQEKLQ